MSKRKSKSTTTATESATQKPIAPGYIEQPVMDYFGRVSSLMGGQGPSSASFQPSALQRQAFSGTANLGTNGAVGEAQGATRALLNFTPDRVTAGQLNDTNLDPYMNPFQRDVIDAASADFDNANRMGLNVLASRTPNGAFGGSRAAVSQGQLVGDNTRNFATQLAALRSGNFAQAQDAARLDIGNRLGADTFNSTQGLNGANFRLGAANQLGNQGIAGDANTRANLGLQADLGAQERDANMAADPAMQQAMWLRQLQALLGLSPEALIGQQRDGTSTGTTRSSQSGFSFGWSPSNGFSIGG